MALSKGCTIAIIVVAALIVILILGLIFVGPKLVQKGVEVLINKAETEIVANIPEEYTPNMVHEIMSDLKVAIKDGQLKPEEIQNLATTFQTAMADNKLDVDESRQLLHTIQTALGQTPPPMEESPGEEMPDSMEAVPDSV
jgi:hypothetical protein